MWRSASSGKRPPVSAGIYQPQGTAVDILDRSRPTLPGPSPYGTAWGSTLPSLLLCVAPQSRSASALIISFTTLSASCLSSSWRFYAVVLEPGHRRRRSGDVRGRRTCHAVFHVAVTAHLLNLLCRGFRFWALAAPLSNGNACAGLSLTPTFTTRS